MQLQSYKTLVSVFLPKKSKFVTGNGTFRMSILHMYAFQGVRPVSHT